MRNRRAACSSAAPQVGAVDGDCIDAMHGQGLVHRSDCFLCMMSLKNWLDDMSCKRKEECKVYEIPADTDTLLCSVHVSDLPPSIDMLELWNSVRARIAATTRTC